jgi:HEAT repeat protein
MVVAALAAVLREHAHEDVRLRAVRALKKFDPDARTTLPALRAGLGEMEGAVAEEAADVLSRLGSEGVPSLAEALPRADERIARLIMQYLGEMGPEARAAIPALLRMLKHTHRWCRYEAASALVNIDRKLGAQKATPVLAALAVPSGDEIFDEDLRVRALQMLRELGSGGKAAVPSLTALLQDEEVDGRWHRRAAETLGCLELNTPEALAALRKATQDRDTGLRVAAAQALGRLGHRREAVALLLEALQHGGDRSHSIDALAEIGPPAKAALPELRKLMRNSGESTRCAAALAVWRIERPVNSHGLQFDPRQDALAVLVEILQSPDLLDLHPAARAIGQIGPEAKPAVPALIRRLELGVPLFSKEILNTLGKIGPEAREAVPALKQLLEHKNEYVCWAAAIALCRMGEASAGLPILVRDMERYPSYMVKYAEPVLADLGREVKPAVPVLLRALRDDDHATYAAAARLLRKIDPDAATKAGVP